MSYVLHAWYIIWKRGKELYKGLLFVDKVELKTVVTDIMNLILLSQSQNYRLLNIKIESQDAIGCF